MRAMGADATALQADVSIPSEAGRLLAEAVSRFGALDILVVNHGIWKRASIDAMSPEEWEETLRINLGGAPCATTAPST